MKEERKDKNDEVVNSRPGAQPSGDIDDFIFGEEGYKCSEK